MMIAAATTRRPLVSSASNLALKIAALASVLCKMGRVSFAIFRTNLA